VPITSISMTPLVLEVHPSVPAKTLKEFFDLVRSEPGKLTMASPGAGTTNHLLSELVQSTLGLKWLTVHYRGNAPAANDLIGGQVQFAFDQISVGLPFIKNGMVRALAVTGTHRAPWIPDVPTFTELGYKEFDGETFTGLFAPASTPAEIVAKIHDTMATILKDPDIVAKFNVLGAVAVAMTPAEFRSYLEAEDSKWIPVVRNANIKAE
jgi:tripartite-type tricarboxylate transporter receptor subunit TctC